MVNILYELVLFNTIWTVWNRHNGEQNSSRELVKNIVYVGFRVYNMSIDRR